MFRYWILSLPLLSAPAGCGPYEEWLGDGVRSESGRGVFHYECTSWGDPECELGDPDTSMRPMPDRIALTGRFDATISFSGTTVGVQSGSEQLVERTSDGLVAVAPGLVAVYGERGDRTVAGWIHIRIVEPAGLRLDGLQTTRLAAGDEYAVSASLVDDRGLSLGGGTDYQWSTEDESVATFAVANPFVPGAELDDSAILRAVGVGETTIRVESAGQLLEATITVEESGP